RALPNQARALAHNPSPQEVPMTTTDRTSIHAAVFDKFLRELEAEAVDDGPEALAELRALFDHAARSYALAKNQLCAEGRPRGRKRLGRHTPRAKRFVWRPALSLDRGQSIPEAYFIVEHAGPWKPWRAVIPDFDSDADMANFFDTYCPALVNGPGEEVPYGGIRLEPVEEMYADDDEGGDDDDEEVEAEDVERPRPPRRYPDFLRGWRAQLDEGEDSLSLPARARAWSLALERLNQTERFAGVLDAWRKRLEHDEQVDAAFDWVIEEWGGTLQKLADFDSMSDAAREAEHARIHARLRQSAERAKGAPLEDGDNVLLLAARARVEGLDTDDDATRTRKPKLSEKRRIVATSMGDVVLVRSGKWWAAESKAFPGAFGQGKTPKAAYENFVSAVRDILETHASLERSIAQAKAGQGVPLDVVIARLKARSRAEAHDRDEDDEASVAEDKDTDEGTDDGMSDDERARLHAALERSIAQAKAGQGVPADVVIARLKARSRAEAHDRDEDDEASVAEDEDEDTDDGMSADERARLHAALERGVAQIQAGRVVSADVVSERLLARSRAEADDPGDWYDDDDARKYLTLRESEFECRQCLDEDDVLAESWPIIPLKTLRNRFRRQQRRRQRRGLPARSMWRPALGALDRELLHASLEESIEEAEAGQGRPLDEYLEELRARGGEAPRARSIFDDPRFDVTALPALTDGEIDRMAATGELPARMMSFRPIARRRRLGRGRPRRAPHRLPKEPFCSWYVLHYSGEERVVARSDRQAALRVLARLRRFPEFGLYPEFSGRPRQDVEKGDDKGAKKDKS
ncbi:MAG: hypothetical protein FWD17_16400, partial [Polyangiaceae bacterium]|nr:hypothetical protein [Polyangiaceae bacterium]